MSLRYWGLSDDQRCLGGILKVYWTKLVENKQISTASNWMDWHFFEMESVHQLDMPKCWPLRPLQNPVLSFPLIQGNIRVGAGFGQNCCFGKPKSSHSIFVVFFQTSSADSKMDCKRKKWSWKNGKTRFWRGLVNFCNGSKTKMSAQRATLLTYFPKNEVPRVISIGQSNGAPRFQFIGGSITLSRNRKGLLNFSTECI